MHPPRSTRRLLAVLLLFAVSAPFLTLGLSNLYLVSPKGRMFVASEISQRIGLETTVKGSSWSPWNGITLYGMRVEQPPQLAPVLDVPFLTVESIQLTPVWKALIKNRRLLVKKIDIRKPKLNAPLELLSQIPSSPPSVPAIASNDATNPPPASEPPPIQKTATVQPQPETPLETIEPIPPAEKTMASINPKKETDPPTVWIKFSEADVRIISTLSKKAVYEISKAGGKIPIGGRSAGNNIMIREVRCLGNEIGSDISVPLKWSSPVLEIGAIDGKIFGLDCSAKAQFSLIKGIPFQIIAAMPEQNDRELCLGEKMRAKLGKVSGKGRMQGFLGFPASWQGQCIVQSLSVDAAMMDNTANFDYCQALLIFRNGALSCVDARIIGDSISILGNATFLSDGRAAANARIIAPPESLVAISKLTQPGSSSLSFTPLSTPQRSALDLQLFGKIGEFFYKPNPRAEPIPLQ